MEQATDAMMMAFAVLVFVIALSISLTMFSRANEVSEMVLASSDTTTYYTYLDPTEEEYSKDRIVGMSSIIPTIYKYSKENYTVLFLDDKYGKLTLYTTQTNKNNWNTDKDR